MRSIDFNLQAGIVAPTGVLSKNKYPVSLSFGNNGLWEFYGDFITEFELKQDIKVGFIFGAMCQLPGDRTLRISVAKEPTIFSTLIGKVRIEPGSTIKVSPYFIMGNLTDGLDFQVRYTYLRHGQDVWKDERADQVPPSYLTTGGPLVALKQRLSQWRSQYVTIEVTYDAKAAMKRWTFDPTVIANYDIPIGGNGMSQTYQFNLGVELHF